MKRISVALTALMMSTAAMAWNCDEERSIEKDFDINDLSNILVHAGAGELNIEGVEETGKIGIEARLCASSEKLLAEMDVRTAIVDDAATIKTQFPRKSSGNYSAAIDLTLTVPKGAKLEVYDSSGDLQIVDVAALVLTDSSGDISIINVPGAVTLTDSSGGIRMKNIGSAEVADSSGDMDIKNVSGDFTVAVDSSGDINVSDVGGNLLVRVDSSGSIDVDEIKGDFTVQKDGSGSIDYSDVGGNVSIPDRKKR